MKQNVTLYNFHPFCSSLVELYPNCCDHHIFQETAEDTPLAGFLI